MRCGRSVADPPDDPVVVEAFREVAGALEASTPGGIDGEPKAAEIVGTTQSAFPGIALGAFGLGIAGLLHKDRQRIFAVLGISLLAVEIAWTSFLILDALAAR